MWKKKIRKKKDFEILELENLDFQWSKIDAKYDRSLVKKN
jgi:hypothetical protein